MLNSFPLPTVSTRLPALIELSAEELAAWMAARNHAPMRVRQVRRWIFKMGATSFEAMTDLPKTLRDELQQSFRIFSMEVDRQLLASDQTHKLLLQLADGGRIECVLIQDEDRRTACISTQVGCAMGCVFCASGLNGVERNLSTGEMLEQLVRLRNLANPIGDHPPRLTHIVVMGMGEPLANLDNLLAALQAAGDPEGLGIGQRHVTISTVGLPAKIRRLAEADKQYHLAISLHAPNDEIRTRIVPTNEKTGIAAILDAADDFFRTTGRQVTYEYVVLGGLNDQPTHARQLTTLLRGRKAHVNLIPWNDIRGLDFRRPTDQDLNHFISELKRGGVSVKVRKRKGSEIDAACGQLRRSVESSARPDHDPPTLTSA